MEIKAHFFYTWNSHKKTTCRFSANNVLFFANKVLIRQVTDYQNKKNLGHREMSERYDAPMVTTVASPIGGREMSKKRGNRSAH